MQDTTGELWAQTRIATSSRHNILCVFTLITWKLQVVFGLSTYRTTALLSVMSIFRFKAGCEIRLVSYGSKHASYSFFPISSLRVLTSITWKLQVIYGRSAHRTTALLSETFLVWLRVAWEIQLETNVRRHESVVFWYNIVCLYKPVHTSLFGAKLHEHDNKTHVPYDSIETMALMPTMHRFIRTKLASYITRCSIFSINRAH